MGSLALRISFTEQLFDDHIDVAVAGQLIAEQVGAEHHIRRKIFKDQAGEALIHLQHHKLLFHPSGQIGRYQQGGGNAAGQVGAFCVVGYGVSLFFDDVGDHVGGRGFSVGAGHRQHLAVEADASQKVGADL